jgi:glycosyl transferase, family 25
MITIGFILENHSTCIKECLESLDKLRDSLTGYTIISSFVEDSNTIETINKWADLKHIKKTNNGAIILYLKGDETITKINVKSPLEQTKSYNIVLESKDYNWTECRINLYLSKTDNYLDIVLKKIILDPNEYTRRAINIIIRGLDIDNMDYLEVSRNFRLGGSVNRALEYLEKVTNKDINYYLECMLNNKDNVLEFYRDYINNLEANYYYLEYLYKNGLYKVACKIIKDMYIIPNSITIVGIRDKLERLKISIVYKLDDKDIFNELYKDSLNKKIVFIDIEPSMTSLELFKLYYKYNNIVYIGLSTGNIDSKFKDGLIDTKYAFINNVSNIYFNNEQIVLDTFGIKAEDVYIKKIIRNVNYIGNKNSNIGITILEDIKKIDICYVINLDERIDRIDNIKNKYSELLNISRISGIKESPGWIGCFKSHQRCLRIAKAQGLDCVLVIEDDCKLVDSQTFKTRWASIKEWLDSNRDKWDVYLGGCTNIKSQHVLEYLELDKQIVRLEFATTTHFVYYNSNIYDNYINYNVTKKAYSPIDLVISNISKGRIVTSVPFLAVQENGFSDIENTDVNYDKMFSDSEKIIIDKRPN